MCNSIRVRDEEFEEWAKSVIGEALFDLIPFKFTMEDLTRGRESMVKSGQLKFIETPYGTLEYIIHPLMEQEAKQYGLA